MHWPLAMYPLPVQAFPCVSIRDRSAFAKRNVSLPPATMDLTAIRKTEDGKVSVVDVIAQIKKCTANYAAKTYKRLLDEERVPTCELRDIQKGTICLRQNRSI